MEKVKVIRERLPTGAESKQSGKQKKSAEEIASIKSKHSWKQKSAEDIGSIRSKHSGKHKKSTEDVASIKSKHSEKQKKEAEEMPSVKTADKKKKSSMKKKKKKKTHKSEHSRERRRSRSRSRCLRDEKIIRRQRLKDNEETLEDLLIDDILHFKEEAMKRFSSVGKPLRKNLQEIAIHVDKTFDNETRFARLLDDEDASSEDHATIDTSESDQETEVSDTIGDTLDDMIDDGADYLKDSALNAKKWTEDSAKNAKKSIEDKALNAKQWTENRVNDGKQWTENRVNDGKQWTEDRVADVKFNGGIAMDIMKLRKKMSEDDDNSYIVFMGGDEISLLEQAPSNLLKDNEDESEEEAELLALEAELEAEKDKGGNVNEEEETVVEVESSEKPEKVLERVDPIVDLFEGTDDRQSIPTELFRMVMNSVGLSSAGFLQPNTSVESSKNRLKGPIDGDDDSSLMCVYPSRRETLRSEDGVNPDRFLEITQKQSKKWSSWLNLHPPKEQKPIKKAPFPKIRDNINQSKKMILENDVQQIEKEADIPESRDDIDQSTKATDERCAPGVERGAAILVNRDNVDQSTKETLEQLEVEIVAPIHDSRDGIDQSTKTTLEKRGAEIEIVSPAYDSRDSIDQSTKRKLQQSVDTEERTDISQSQALGREELSYSGGSVRTPKVIVMKVQLPKVTPSPSEETSNTQKNRSSPSPSEETSNTQRSRKAKKDTKNKKGSKSLMKKIFRHKATAD